jgi:predicted trehalose synthase
VDPVLSPANMGFCGGALPYQRSLDYAVIAWVDHLYPKGRPDAPARRRGKAGNWVKNHRAAVCFGVRFGFTCGGDF